MHLLLVCLIFPKRGTFPGTNSSPMKRGQVSLEGRVHIFLYHHFQGRFVRLRDWQILFHDPGPQSLHILTLTLMEEMLHQLRNSTPCNRMGYLQHQRSCWFQLSTHFGTICEPSNWIMKPKGFGLSRNTKSEFSTTTKKH